MGCDFRVGGQSASGRHSVSERADQDLRDIMELMALGRTLIAIGVILVLAGLLLTFGARLPLRIGRLPGDIVIRGRYSVFYFPLATCIVLSLVLSIIVWVLNR